MARRHPLLAVTLAAAALLVAAAPATAAPVTFGGGHLDWGVKQSFRNYIVTIAHGSYTAEDGAEVLGPGGVIRFDVLGGSYDDATGAGELTIGGKVRFEGHDGALDLTMSNLCVTFAGGTGTTYGDLVSKDRDSGSTEIYTGVTVVDMASVPAPVPVSGGLEWSSIATTLNAAAAPAFGQYPAGAEFDPLEPLTATFGTPTPRPSGGPCRSLPSGGGGGGNGGGGTGGGGGTTTPPPTTPSVAPRALPVKGAVLVPRGRVATVGRLRCGSTPCKVSVPKSVKVKIAGKRYRVTVLAPRSLAAERVGKVRVKLTRAARKALVGRRATAKVKVAIIAEGRKITKTIVATLKAKSGQRTRGT